MIVRSKTAVAMLAMHSKLLRFQICSFAMRLVPYYQTATILCMQDVLVFPIPAIYTRRSFAQWNAFFCSLSCLTLQLWSQFMLNMLCFVPVLVSVLKFYLTQNFGLEYRI